MSAARATYLVNEMVKAEKATTESLERAVESVARHSKVPYWTLQNLRRARAKTVTSDIYAAIERAYLEMCLSQALKWLHQIETNQRVNPHVDYSDLAREAQDVMARVLDKRAHSSGGSDSGRVGDRSVSRGPGAGDEGGRGRD